MKINKALLSKTMKIVSVFILMLGMIMSPSHVFAESMTSNSVVAGTDPNGEGPAEMILQKSVNDSEYKIGDIIEYKVSLTCMKALKYKNIVIEDTMPEGVKLLPETFKWSYTSGSYTYSESVFELTFGKPDIVLSDNSFSFSCMTTANYMQGNNAHIDFTYQVQIVDEKLAGQSLTNTATLHFNEEPDEKARVSTTVDILPLPKAVLSIDKTVDRDIVDMGNIVTYTIRATQTIDTLTAKDVIITDLIPNGLIVDKESIKVSGIDNYTITLENHTLILTIPTLEYNQEVIITYTAMIDVDIKEKDIINIATIEANNADKVQDSAQIKIDEEIKTPPVDKGPTNPTPDTPDTPNVAETPTEEPKTDITPTIPSKKEEPVKTPINSSLNIEKANKVINDEAGLIHVVETGDMNTFMLYKFSFLALSSLICIKKVLSKN